MGSQDRPSPNPFIAMPAARIAADYSPPPRGTMVVGGPANLLDAAIVDSTKIDAFIAQRRDTSGFE